MQEKAYRLLAGGLQVLERACTDGAGALGLASYSIAFVSAAQCLISHRCVAEFSGSPHRPLHDRWTPARPFRERVRSQRAEQHSIPAAG
jgi:hypothetical protein